MPAKRRRNAYDRTYRTARARMLAGPGGDQCVYCGRPISDLLRVGHPQKAESDHVVPAFYGGSPRDGLAPCCHQCNASKQHRSVGAWLGDQPAPPWAVPGWASNPAARPSPQSQEW